MREKYTDEDRRAFLHVIFCEPRNEHIEFFPRKVRARVLSSAESSRKSTHASRLARIGKNWLREEIKQTLFDIEAYNGIDGFLESETDAFFKVYGILNTPEGTYFSPEHMAKTEKQLFDDINSGYNFLLSKTQSAIERFRQAVTLLSPRDSEWIRQQWELTNLSERLLPHFYPIDRDASPPKRVGLNPIDKLLCSEAQRVDALERLPVFGPNF